MGVSFVKMHGAGNDFVVLDERAAPVHLTAARAAAIADRHCGIGCDQIISIARSERADAFMRILNADGSVAQACGNATRCVAMVLFQETNRSRLAIETVAGVLAAEVLASGEVEVDMGEPRLKWDEIPLARPLDTLHLPLAGRGVSDPAAVSIGNPHATFFVADAEAVSLAELGPRFERDPLFPERANIGFASLCGPERMRLRVWERGAGATRACGSGACAAVVNAHRRGIASGRLQVQMDGGTLAVTWRTDNHLLMSGPAARAFSGELDPAAFPP
ncbi:MAG: diaminopimelate epimerase [Acetobacteraceae bacterium]